MALNKVKSSVKPYRRRDGKDGWTKGQCPYSGDGWAWWKDGDCTCRACKAPKEKK